MRKLLPRSLRSRLILSFGILIFLSLFLAGTATVYLLRDQQETSARERVGLLALPVTLRAAYLEARGHNPRSIQAVLEEEYDVRILLVNGDTVLGDSGDRLLGEKIAALGEQGLPARPLSDLRYQVKRFRQGPENLLPRLSPEGALAAIPGVPSVLVPEYQAIIAVEESDVNQAWRDLLPRLFLAGGVSFLASVVAAGVLARSITRPLRQITAASEVRTQGRYEQRISLQGGEEVARLAGAFKRHGPAGQPLLSHTEGVPSQRVSRTRSAANLNPGFLPGHDRWLCQSRGGHAGISPRQTLGSRFQPKPGHESSTASSRSTRSTCGLRAIRVLG